MAKLYADEDFPLPVVEELRRLAHDIRTVQEAGQGGQGIDDALVLNFAIGQGRAVLTYNRRDYIRLHRQVRPHCGVIVCTKDDDFVALAARIDRALAGCPILDNQLIRVVRPHRP
jgi:predicted nuclease of predicted toxin-antitoxin system